MDASTRLYARLGEMPENPNDPESLDDLIVCAFGAFERYYLCWKTKSGEFRHNLDGYDLPPALNEWLNPADGTTRDWASLQVVFGRGEECFASDKHGKLEFKEPEAKRSAEEEEKDKGNKQARRRSRTVSFLRPLSQTSIRSDNTSSDTSAVNRRTSSVSSQRASRPPSLSYSNTGSDVSLPILSETQPQLQEPAPAAQSSFSSLLTFNNSSSKSAASKSDNNTVQPQSVEGILPANTANTAVSVQNLETPSSQSQTLSKGSVRSGITAIPEEATERTTSTNTDRPEACTCGCHDPPLSQAKRPTYANASVQTDPISSPPRSSLRVDTFSASNWGNHSYSAVSQNVQTTPVFDTFGTAPFSMGRMTNYFSKPGYQLGDSLASGYHYYEQPIYQYQDEFGAEALR
ncbi:hypothetical protein SVAN01_11589 [Stagonosporopsis vannaccii]|nr:hypothetical protein SVAN01_11589 [Stagonosporopsis vannaccii]